MAITMDGHITTKLKLKASDGSEVTKLLTEEGTIPTPTETLNINTNGERDVTHYKKVNVQIEGGGELPELVNPASASDIAKDKEAIDGSGNKIIGTNTFDADTSDANATAGDILQGKTAYVNGVKLLGTLVGGSLPSSITKIDGGSFTLETATAVKDYEIQHTIGEVPKGVYVWAVNSEALLHPTNSFLNGGIFGQRFVSSAVNRGANSSVIYLATNGAFKGVHIQANYPSEASSLLTDSVFKFGFTADVDYEANQTYNWLAWA